MGANLNTGWNSIGRWVIYPALIFCTLQLVQAQDFAQPSNGNHTMKLALLTNVEMNKATYYEGEKIKMIWSLINKGSKDVFIVSHYATYSQRRHFDHLELRVQRQQDNKKWELSLSGPRKAAARIVCRLLPGETLRHEIDVSYWLSLQGINLGTGTYGLSAVYNIAPDEAKGLTEWAKCSDINPSDSGDEPHLLQGKSQVLWHGSIISNMATFMVSKK
ncbi:MAG: hypothetical protein HZA08_02905 [Nitrospirae bacterium]|nr:hypothetical protein [Nitrospirota bacterium]